MEYIADSFNAKKYTDRYKDCDNFYREVSNFLDLYKIELTNDDGHIKIISKNNETVCGIINLKLSTTDSYSELLKTCNNE